jgi:2'-5' RNA ligase
MAQGSTTGQALKAGTQRLFFALWPDARVRADLAAAAQRMHRLVDGNCSRAESLHMTLAFLGDVDMDNIARLLAPPSDVFVSGFGLVLDQCGCWSRNGVGWAAPSHVPEPLRDLAANLEAWLRGAGFELERRVFVPHVTLVRKARCAPLPDAMTPIAWRVGEFALIHSQFRAGGARYRILGSWPLQLKD